MPTETCSTINPATGQLIETFPMHSAEATERMLARAAHAFQQFRRTPIAVRADLLRSFAATLRRDRDRLAATITHEMGKIIGESEAEVEKCARQAEWYAEHGPAMLADEPAPVPTASAHIAYLPMGPILAVMPWNFPLWQVIRFVLPTLLAGNVVLLKHAPNTQRCAQELERVARDAGFLEGALQNLFVPVEQVGAILNDDRVRGVSLTGSVRAGSAVAELAGKAIKPSVLELGGSDAFLVLEDADLPRAVAAGIRGRFGNAGQVCLAAKRFLLAAPIADSFTADFVAAARALRVGDPMDRTMQLGPMARADLRDELHDQVTRSVALGARLLCGGHALEGPGFFYAPTVLADVTPEMPVFAEETFGPVAALTRVRDADEAVALANRSDYGLSSVIWTRDLARARRLSSELDTGAVFINSVSASDPRIPVGGVKRSGYGRELSHFGPRAFCNVQTVWVEPSPDAPEAEVAAEKST